jgi:speckle-type POZ protein
MFEHDTKESQESQVTVEVCDAKIMKEVLKYIYTGRVYQLKKIAANLLKAANYYGLTELAGYCEQALMIELNMDNLPDMYGMAVTYNCPLLKERATTLLGK